MTTGSQAKNPRIALYRQNVHDSGMSEDRFDLEQVPDALSGDSACDHERAPKMKRQIRTDLQGKTTLPCARVTV
jgi:hypothetical protein